MRAGIDPSYDSKRYDGERYQAYIQDVHLILTGHALQCYATEYWQRIRESIQKTEIKHDAVMRRTGNIYFELEERTDTRKGWTRSGVQHEEQERYIIGDYEHAYVFNTDGLAEDLLALDALGIARRVETATSKGILLRVQDAKKLRQYRGDMVQALKEQYSDDDTVQEFLRWGLAEQERSRT